MPATDTGADIAERLRELRERIRRRLQRPVPSLPAVASANTTDAIGDSTAAARRLAGQIGAVNPRPPGFLNELLQTTKEAIARMLDWQLRPQREFNRNVVESLESATRLLEIQCRNTEILAQSFEPLIRLYQELARDVDSTQEYFDERMKQQRWTYEGALVRQSKELQERAASLYKEYWQQVQEELIVLRQQVASQAKAAAPFAPTGQERQQPSPAAAGPKMDYFRFEQAFRGSEEDIRARQSFYRPFFQGRKNVLDIACGRGEFLELMRELNVPARGVDLDSAMIARCRQKGLSAVTADAFAHLSTVPDSSLDGIFCAHFVEHLPPESYVEMISQAARKLAPAGVLAIETPNPECLAIFSQTFFIDPTHRRPIPPAQLRFLFAEAGFAQVTTHFLSPASAGLPVIPLLNSRVVEADRLRAWNDAVTRFNETFFGGMDYAVIGHRPA